MKKKIINNYKALIFNFIESYFKSQFYLLGTPCIVVYIYDLMM